MPKARVIEGDLFDNDADVIVHQCNCVTWASAHLAGDVFQRYPWADIYTPRKGTDHKDKPGTVILRGDGQGERYVAAILGQFYPGKPKYPSGKKDGVEARKHYFHSGLLELQQLAINEGFKSIAFPWCIGCGAAGGDWEFYHELIDRLADATPGLDIRIYKLKEQSRA
jgi:O-acetyl-ADP-ribose deacetylase (regulator of RNase III)